VNEAKAAAGFVYILINPGMPGLVKIGFTTDQSTARAVQLSRPTGVPADFDLVYDELVRDCAAVEHRLHERFAANRFSSRREFFRVPVRQAIAALQEEARSYPVTPLPEQKVDILPGLEHRLRRWLRADLVGVYVIQLDSLVYLESVFQPHAWLKDQEIKRMDLSFISDDLDTGEPLFSPSNQIAENARLFIELDTYTIHYLTDLFNDEANERIADLHRYHEEIPFAP